MAQIFNSVTPPSSKSEKADEAHDRLGAYYDTKMSAKRLWLALRKMPLQLVLLAVSGLLSSLTYLFIPSVLGYAIDQMIGQGLVNWTRLWPFIGLSALLYALSSFFHWLMQAQTQNVTGRLTKDLRNEGFAKISRLPLKTLDSHPHGDLISRLTADLEAIAEGVGQVLNQVFYGLPLLLGSFIMLVSISLSVSLVVFAITPLCFWVTSIIAKRSYKHFQEQAQDLGQVNAHIEENLANQAIIQAFNAEDERDQIFEGLNETLYESGQKAQLYSSLTNPGVRFLNNVAYVLVAGLSAILALAGTLTVGQMTALLNYALQFAKPINEISAVFTQLQNSFAGAGRIYALFDAEEISSDAHASELVLTDGQVSFEQVDFSYRSDQKLIENLNLDVPADAMVAIVGPTGAGKTTLVNLLMRFYELDAGRILIDSQNISKVTRTSLRRNIGMVLQDSWIFSGTVHQNIAYGKPEASRAEVEEAARMAMAHGFIRRLPKGYDTVLEGNGEALSVGQRQLLTIARTLLIAPELLILDEATSAIDTRTELLVQKAFLKIMEGRTSFIIAHRLSTIREASEILVMDKGAVIEQGTHEELLAARGFYAELYESQYRLIT